MKEIRNILYEIECHLNQIKSIDRGLGDGSVGYEADQAIILFEKLLRLLETKTEQFKQNSLAHQDNES